MLQQMPELFNGMTSGTNGFNMMQYVQQFEDPAFLGKFVTITRTDDGSGDTATFETTVDIGALMSDPTFQNMMQQQMQTQLQAQGQTLSQKEMDQAMAMSTQMLQGMTVTVTEDIGISDSFIHSEHMSFSFDTSGMMDAMGSAASSSAATPQSAPTVSVDFVINFSDFNSAPTISAPENATVIPYQSILNFLPMSATPEPTPEATAGM